MSDVPKQAYYIGLAGVLPYLATSASTVACAYEINHAVAGYGYVLSTEFATDLLHFLEPLQIGYGAVVSASAVHWRPRSILTVVRSSPSSARSTGVWSSLGTVATRVTNAMPLAWSRLPWPGQLS